MMEALRSTSSKLSGASSWTEVTGSVGLLLLEGGCLPESGTVEGSGAVSGSRPDLEPLGVLSPLRLESGRLPCGASRTTSSWLRTCWDATSVPSVGWGRKPLEVNSHPTSPGSRSTTRQARPWADCIVIFGVRRSCARKEHYELLWCTNTYDLARGLALCGHSSSPSSVLVE